MLKKNEIVLGGGIAGLLWSFYNPDSVILSDNIGGQFNAPFSLGPRLIHVDENTTRFFSDVNYKPPVKKIKIGFFYDGKLNSVNSEKNRIDYFRKTRGEGVPYKSSMSGNVSEFDSYDVEDNILVQLLLDRIKNEIIRENAMSIDTDSMLVKTHKETYKYDSLVSTIPMNVFLKLSGSLFLSMQFKSFPTSFFLIDKLDSWFDNDLTEFEKYDYVYVSSPAYPFHRITRTNEGYVLESKGDVEVKHQNKILLKVGQLIHNEINVHYNNVRFFGRYATWNQSIKINELLKEIYDIKRNNS